MVTHVETKAVIFFFFFFFDLDFLPFVQKVVLVVNNEEDFQRGSEAHDKRVSWSTCRKN